MISSFHNIISSTKWTSTTAFRSWTWKRLLLKGWGCYLSSRDGWRTSPSSSQSLGNGAQEEKGIILLQPNNEQEKWALIPVKSTLEFPLENLDEAENLELGHSSDSRRCCWQTQQLPPRLSSGKVLWILKGLQTSSPLLLFLLFSPPWGHSGESGAPRVSTV